MSIAKTIQLLVPFKWVNCVVCEVYLNKGIIKRSKRITDKTYKKAMLGRGDMHEQVAGFPTGPSGSGECSSGQVYALVGLFGISF